MPDSIGQQLQQARKARGVTIEEAAQATRIRVHYLRALENDAPEDLPSPVHGRGFLRNYSAYLEIDPQPLLDQWEGKKHAAADPETPLPVSTAPTRPPRIILEGFQKTASNTPGGEPPVLIKSEREEPEPRPALSQSQEIFREIGEQLRRQRELLSLALPEVERYTKVRVHYLKAVEEGDLDHLPSMVQSRGMLNNYARFLNLDADSLLNRFADALQARRLELNPGALPSTPNPSQRMDAQGGAYTRVASYPALRRFLSMDLLVVSGMIIILVGFVIWTASMVMANQSQKSQAATAPAIGEVLFATGSPSVDRLGNLIAVQSSSTVTAPLEPGTNPATAATGTLPASSATPAAAGIPSLSPGKIQLYIVARQRSWIKVLVDDRTSFIGRVETGSAYPFNASRRIELVTGNAGGLQVFFNQQDFGNLGSANEVVDLLFTTQGIQTPTASPTPTITRTPFLTTTPVPSATRRPSATPQSTIPGPP